MKESLYEKLKNYAESDVYPFCMPGHKRQFEVPGLSSPYEIDITEVDGFDNLHDPSGLLKELQERLAEIYNVPRVFLSVNGSSAGMLAAVSAVPAGGAVCVARNCHKSVFDGVSLSRRKVYYLYPEEIVPDSMVFGGADPAALEKILTRHTDIKAVVVTSPTYEGFLSDIQALAETAHRFGALLIVDEAHGAHLPYHKDFPVSAIYLGADIVVQSLHKTLPSLNQTSLVFVNGDAELQRRVARFLSVYTTTSPSYVLLASIEHCVQWCVDHEDKFDEYIRLLSVYRERCANLPEVQLLGKELIGTKAVYDVDLTKMAFLSSRLPGSELGRYLLKEHHLQLEAAGPSHVLALTSVMDTEEGFRRLLAGLSASAQVRDCLPPSPMSEKQIEQISLSALVKAGRVYKDFIYLYPPGCPIVAPGEIYTREIKEKVQNYIELGLEVIVWERFTF